MKTYIHPQEEAGKQFYMDFHQKGEIVMLNLLKFKPIADYTGMEALKPEGEVTGEEAYKLYMQYTRPHLKEAGSRLLFSGSSGNFLIGPEQERWDLALLVAHQSVAKFIAFSQNEAYLKTAGHRTAALEDSRLLPMTGDFKGM